MPLVHLQTRLRTLLSQSIKKDYQMSYLIKLLSESGLLTKNLDYHLMRASMVIIFVMFGYQKWFEYEAQ
jgi:hypothetical protein